MKAEMWVVLRDEYIRGATYKELAARYGVSPATVCRRAKAENWKKLRSASMESAQSPGDTKPDIRLDRINALTDRLLDKLEQAIDELSVYNATDVTKTRTIEYSNAERPDKPTKEIVDEHEQVTAYRGIIDRNGLKQVAAALKELKDVHLQYSKDASSDGTITVELGDAKEYAQ